LLFSSIRRFIRTISLRHHYIISRLNPHPFFASFPISGSLHAACNPFAGICSAAEENEVFCILLLRNVHFHSVSLH